MFFLLLYLSRPRAHNPNSPHISEPIFHFSSSTLIGTIFVPTAVRKQHLGVANGKIRDPCLKIRDRDLQALTKSEPKTLYQENRARDFILRKSEPVPKTVSSGTWQIATWYSKNVRSISQEFQNVTPWRLIFDLKTRLVAPTYSKDCYHTF